MLILCHFTPIHSSKYPLTSLPPRGIRGGLATPGRGGEVLYVKAMLLGGKSIVIRR